MFKNNITKKIEVLCLPHLHSISNCVINDRILVQRIMLLCYLNSMLLSYYVIMLLLCYYLMKKKIVPRTTCIGELLKLWG